MGYDVPHDHTTLEYHTPVIVSRDANLVETWSIFQWIGEWEFMYFVGKLVYLITTPIRPFALPVTDLCAVQYMAEVLLTDVTQPISTQLKQHLICISVHDYGPPIGLSVHYPSGKWTLSMWWCMPKRLAPLWTSLYQVELGMAH